MRGRGGWGGREREILDSLLPLFGMHPAYLFCYHILTLYILSVYTSSLPLFPPPPPPPPPFSHSSLQPPPPSPSPLSLPSPPLSSPLLPPPHSIERVVITLLVKLVAMETHHVPVLQLCIIIPAMMHYRDNTLSLPLVCIVNLILLRG